MTDPNASQPGDSPAPVPAFDGASENLLRHYANVLVRRWKWVALGLFIGLVAGIVSTFVVTEAPVTTRYYKATNTLSQKSPSSESGSNGGYSLSQAALQAESLTLLNKVGKAVGMSSDQVAASIDATVRPNVDAIDVTAIATQPEVAVELANTAADSLRLLAEADAGNTVESKRRSLQSQLDSSITQRDRLKAQTGGSQADQLLRVQRVQQLEDDIKDLTEQIGSLPTSGGGFTLEVLLPATPIEINARGYNYRHSQNLNSRSRLANPNSSNTSAPDFDETDLSRSAGLSDSTRILLGSAAGLVLGLISAFVLEAWDDRIRRRDRVEELTGLGVLTEIPHLAKEQSRDHHVAVEDETTGAAAERFRAARTAITFALEERDPAAAAGAPVLLVTSPGPAEGKTTTVANLAAAFADDGNRVLVIDGDFRRPTVRRYLAPVPNLITPDEPTETRIANVSFLPGPHDAASPETANARLATSIAAWRAGYDLVILDTPPILTTNDAVDLLESADAVVLVLRADRTRANAARRVAGLLGQYRANVLGVVLNSCDRSEMNQYYGYGYGYGYGYLGKAGSKSGRSRKKGHESPVTATPEPEHRADSTDDAAGTRADEHGAHPTAGGDTPAGPRAGAAADAATPADATAPSIDEPSTSTSA